MIMETSTHLWSRGRVNGAGSAFCPYPSPTPNLKGKSAGGDPQPFIATACGGHVTSANPGQSLQLAEYCGLGAIYGSAVD
jgi:hypothetical protein